LRLNFHIDKVDKTYVGKFDSPDQGAKDIPITTIEFDSSNLKMTFSKIGAVYEGVIAEEKITGNWKQGAASFKLDLAKSKIIKKRLERYQEPKKPYPYFEEDVVFKNKKDAITLHGTLTLPSNKGKFPVAILISGSGSQNRDEELFGHKPFLVLADHLTKKGIAVLRFDDRGYGDNEKNHNDFTTYDFATDVISAITYLKTRKDIKRKEIGLIGHSEGAIIAPLVNNRIKKGVAFIVSLAGTGISGTELSVMQSKTLRSFPVPDEELYEKYIREAIKIASQNKEIITVQKELRAHYNKTTVPIIKNLGVPEDQVNKIIDNYVKMRTSNWSRYFYDYNPANEYRKVACPVLSLNGDNDKQVVAKINQEGLRQALVNGKNKDFKILELKGLNHLFQESKTGNVNEYSEIEQTFSPIALNEISKWVLKRVR